jgi:hypothetical protein
VPEIVRFKITLDNVKPTVMRRIEVPVAIKLDLLHEIIQAIMPWDNYYDFRVRDTCWGPRGNGDRTLAFREAAGVCPRARRNALLKKRGDEARAWPAPEK